MDKDLPLNALKGEHFWEIVGTDGKNTWKFTAYNDARARRLVCGLLVACPFKYIEVLRNGDRVSTVDLLNEFPVVHLSS